MLFEAQSSSKGSLGHMCLNQETQWMHFSHVSSACFKNTTPSSAHWSQQLGASCQPWGPAVPVSSSALHSCLKTPGEVLFLTAHLELDIPSPLQLDDTAWRTHGAVHSFLAHRADKDQLQRDSAVAAGAPFALLGYFSRHDTEFCCRFLQQLLSFEVCDAPRGTASMGGDKGS